jgi:hypothetical protein
MQQYKLELHPHKTKIVYCKNYQRNDKHDNNSFTFLSYSFQPGTIRDKFGRRNRLVEAEMLLPIQLLREPSDCTMEVHKRHNESHKGHEGPDFKNRNEKKKLKSSKRR